MPTLNELTSDYERVLALIEDESIDDEVIQDTMDSIESSIEVKLDNYATIIKELEFEQKKFQAQATDKQKLATTYKKRLEWLKKNMLTSLQLTGKKKMETENFRLSLHKNPPALDVVDELLIPESYFENKRKLLNEKVKDDLKVGKEVPGAILKQGESVVIK